MWQNPLLPPHLLVQSILLGSAVLVMLAVMFRGAMTPDGMFTSIALDVHWVTWTLVITTLIHLLMVWGEVSLTHPTSHARLAVWEMVKGRYRRAFWAGMILSFLGGLVPLLVIFEFGVTTFVSVGAVFALAGMLLFEHAYVQAGQSVPLA